MKINNCFMPQPCIAGMEISLVNAMGCVQSADVDMAREHLLAVYIDEVLAMELVCTPDMLPELVLGRLVTEGMVSSPKDIELLYICDQGARCRVFLSPDALLLEAVPETVLSCCTGNRVFLRPPKAGLQSAAPFLWRPEWILSLANVFAQDTPDYKATHGVHSCMLAMEDRLLYRCEDLGRHNALDKVIGCAFRDGLDLRHTILYTSGRVPVDMMQKVIRSGVPVIVSNSVPTDAATALAREYGITLIC